VPEALGDLRDDLAVAVPAYEGGHAAVPGLPEQRQDPVVPEDTDEALVLLEVLTKQVAGRI
jgi:hypothetical protein